jgi:exopolysaccharide production protein ExoQ
MSPRIALLLCLVFVVVLFKIDRKAKAEVSIALWIPSIWLLILGSRMVSQWFANYSGSAESYEAGSPMDSAILLVLTVSAFVIVIKRGLNFSEIIKNNSWIFLFLLYCGISIVWSDFPFVSLKRYIKEIGNLLMVLLVYSENNLVESIKTLIKRSAYILVPFSIILYKYYPDLGRLYDIWVGGLIITGVTNNKNSLGILCFISAIGFIWNFILMLKNKTILVNKMKTLTQTVMLIMTIWLLWVANSATSKACFVLGVCILAATTVEVIRRRFRFYTLLIILLVSLLYMMVDLGALLLGTLGRDETLTGRTELWGDLRELVANPVIGVGYGSFWLGERLEKLWDVWWWHPTQSHNGYMEIYLNLGIVGCILLIGVLISSFQSAFKTVISDFEYGSLRLVLLIVTIPYNMTEAAFRVDLLMYFYFILAALSPASPVRPSNQTGMPASLAPRVHAFRYRTHSPSGMPASLAARVHAFRYRTQSLSGWYPGSRRDNVSSQL